MNWRSPLLNHPLDFGYGGVTQDLLRAENARATMTDLGTPLPRAICASRKGNSSRVSTFIDLPVGAA